MVTLDRIFKGLKANYQYAALYCMLFMMLVLLVPNAGFASDLDYWIGWANYTFENGLSNIYQLPSNNYNPLYHYILFLYGKLAGNLINISHYLHYLKAFTLVFDFAGAILAASLVKNKEKRFMFSLLLLFNIGYLYNTLAWEQVDAIYSCLSFFAVILAVRGKVTWSLVCYLLALNAKTQAIIFLPLLLLMWAPAWLKSWKALGTSLVTAAIVQVLLLVPFVWFGKQNDLPRIMEVVSGSVDFYPVVSMNAFNFWNLTMPGKNLMEVSDALLFNGITYKNWGLLLFMVFSAITLFPVLLISVRKIVTGQHFNSRQQAILLLCGGLIPVLFCYFNTQMHERYWHAALIFLAAYGFITRKFSIYIICSIAYFLNLEKVLGFLKLRNYSIAILDPLFIAGLFAVVILLGIGLLYRDVPWKSYWAEIRQGLAPAAEKSKVYAEAK